MNNSHEKETAKLSSHVHEVLGDRLNTFYRQRFVALNEYLGRLLKNHLQKASNALPSLPSFLISVNSFENNAQALLSKSSYKNMRVILRSNLQWLASHSYVN